MRTVLLSVVAVLSAAAALCGPAVAAQPDRQTTAYASFEDNSCGFPVLFSFPASNRTTTTLYDRDGNVTRIHETGRLVVTLTNETNSNSLTISVSGPVRIDVGDGTFTAAGRGIGPAPETGVAGLVLVAGRIEMTGGTFAGHATALCPVLAGTAAPTGKPATPATKPANAGPAPGPAAGQSAEATPAEPASGKSNDGQGRGQGEPSGSNQGQGKGAAGDSDPGNSAAGHANQGDGGSNKPAHP